MKTKTRQNQRIEKITVRIGRHNGKSGLYSRDLKRYARSAIVLREDGLRPHSFHRVWLVVKPPDQK